MIETKDVDAIINLAREMAAVGLAENNEYKLRSAASRAYYAVFLLARQRMRVQSPDSVHSAVISAVRRRSKLVGDSLYTLKEYRQSADYDFPPKDEHKNWVANWAVVEKKSTSLLETFKRW